MLEKVAECVSVRFRASKLFTYITIVLMHYLSNIATDSKPLAFQSTSKQLTTAIIHLDVHPFLKTTK